MAHNLDVAQNLKLYVFNNSLKALCWNVGPCASKYLQNILISGR